MDKEDITVRRYPGYVRVEEIPKHRLEALA